jgi:hypothetical protein
MEQTRVRRNRSSGRVLSSKAGGNRSGEGRSVHSNRERTPTATSQTARKPSQSTWTPGFVSIGFFKRRCDDIQGLSGTFRDFYPGTQKLQIFAFIPFFPVK